MARRSKSRGIRRQHVLPTVHAYAAGIDIGATFHVVAVPPALSPEPVRTYKSFTGALHQLADWLVELGVTTVAMESTGIYWIPVFEILEARGVEVLLVNARHVKNVPGRKTDATTRSGCSSSISMAYCGAASTRRTPGRLSAHICVTARACWHMRRSTSSTCQKR